MLPTLSNARTQQIVDRIGLHEMPDAQAPYFYPARDGGNQRSPCLYPAQDGGKSQDNDGNNRETKAQATTGIHTDKRSNNHQTPGPPARRATPRRTHGAREEQRRKRTCQSQSARGGRRTTTRGMRLPPAVKNSLTVTPSKPVPAKERQLTTLATAPPTTHIQTVPKPPFAKRTVRPCSMVGQPVAPKKERREEKGKRQNAGAIPDGAAAALQTNMRAPYLYPARDGGIKPAQTSNIDPNLRGKHISRHAEESRNPRTHRPHARPGEGPRKPRADTKADGSTKSRDWKKRSEPGKKCLANPLRETECDLKLNTLKPWKKHTNSNSFAWRPPRIALHKSTRHDKNP